jgi:hypothetical protein
MVLPLSLLGAEAILLFWRERGDRRQGKIIIVLVFAFQLGFQMLAIAQNLYGSDQLAPVRPDYNFQTPRHPRAQGEFIYQVATVKKKMAGELSPVRSKMYCYQNMQYPQGMITPGPQLVMALEGIGDPARCEGKWLNFRSFRVQCRDPELSANPNAPVKAIFNQNYYRYWSGEAAGNNLALSTTAKALVRGVTMTYTDPWAEWGYRVSKIMLRVWATLLAGLGALWIFIRSREAKPGPENGLVSIAVNAGAQADEEGPSGKKGGEP